MSTATPAIEVVGIEKHYGAVRAVDDLSLRVEVGEVFGILGPNGAGKTTTVEILEGYRAPDRGTVRVLGLDPIADGAAVRPKIGVMLQEGGIAPGIRPLEVLRLFAAFYDDADDPERLLELVGLADSRATYVRRLSGGQRQRLSLALALVGRPRLLFLDEPTAGMDPHARATTWDLIRSLRADGVTVVMTTHGMDEAEQLCDRLAIVDRGQLVALGTPTELTSAAAVSEARFTAIPGLAVARLASMLGLGADAVTEVRAGEYVLATEATPEVVADLACWLRDEGVRLGELQTGRRTLEEVFLRLTREVRS
ncbi:MAG TPA: ABC transporter ATP-binding protein [Acidimicrobiia bacterium]|nr:ABC transporter ATP-binding protein [Acidimicrobiia bacterium]